MTTAADAQLPRPRDARRSRASRVAMGILLGIVVVLLAVVILTPIALSSQDLIDWAAPARCGSSSSLIRPERG